MNSSTKKILFILGGLLSISIVILYFSVTPEEADFLPKCPLFVATGYYCTGCGSQRALHDLLHLDFAGVLNHNLLFLPALGIVLYHGIIKWLEHRNKRTFKNLLYHRRTPLIILMIVMVFTILRNIKSYPFSALAP